MSWNCIVVTMAKSSSYLALVSALTSFDLTII
jgi:hypothetical protein